MSDDGSGYEEVRGREKLPKWFGYAFALAAQAAVTAVVLLLPEFPIGRSSSPYIVTVLAVAYLFGDGPAVLALLAGSVAFTWSFGPGAGGVWGLPAGARQWVSFIAYLLGSAGGAFVISLLRRYAQRVERLASQLGVAKELAERRRSELETVLLSASDAILVVNLDSTIAYANEAADQVFRGCIRRGEPFAELVEAARIREMDGTPAAVHELAVMRALANGTASDKTALVNGESGPETVLSVHASPIRGPDGEIEGAVGIIRNITCQWRADEALRQSEERYRSLVELVPHGIAEVDLSGVITFANSALCGMLGCPPHEMIGRPVWEVTEPGEQAEAVRSLILRAAAEHIPPEACRTRVPAADGGLTDIQVDWDYRRDPEGRVVGFTSVVTDVTEQLRTRKELERDYEREHRIAQTLQTSLMRPVPRRIGGFVFEKLYRAAGDEARIGGDFYDVFPLDDDKIGIVIGDVSGKGLKAAVQVAAAKYSLRGRAYECHSPKAVMEQVNRTLVQDMEAEGFTSVFLGILDCRRSALTYANAGHAPVIHWSASKAQAVLFEPTGPVAGISSGAEFGELDIELEIGDELLLGTDGLYEIQCGGSYLEIDRLLDIYAEMKSQGMSSAAELVNRVVEYCQGEPRDDIAVLRVSVEG